MFKFAKHISALRKDISMFFDHSGTSDQGIDTLSNMQLSSTSRENRREKNIISSIHRDNVIRACKVSDECSNR